jgi:hypothetical protein
MSDFYFVHSAVFRAEEFRVLRTSLRANMDKDRDSDEADMETTQSTVDFLLTSVHYLHVDAIQTLSQSVACFLSLSLSLSLSYRADLILAIRIFCAERLLINWALSFLAASRS